MSNPEPAEAGNTEAAFTAARRRIAAAVRAEAGRANIRQTDIARILNLPASSISLRWHGTRSYAAEELDGIAALIGVPVGRLYEATDSIND